MFAITCTLSLDYLDTSEPLLELKQIAYLVNSIVSITPYL